MLVLASRSPRRADLLRQAGIPFTVRAADVDESLLPAESPRAYVLRLAEAKARAVQAASNETILAADTTVVVDHQILAKPEDAADARRMLTLLAGRDHQVLTGVCLRRGATVVCDCAVTTVQFGPMTADEIADYAATGEPIDKAGAYAIQGLASKYVDRIEGDYCNVVGLPVSLVYRLLRTLPPSAVGQASWPANPSEARTTPSTTSSTPPSPPNTRTSHAPHPPEESTPNTKTHSAKASCNDSKSAEPTTAASPSPRP